MNDYTRLVKLAWATFRPVGEYLRNPFPIGTRFAFRRDEHRQLRACFIEYSETGFVDMIASYVVDEHTK